MMKSEVSASLEASPSHAQVQRNEADGVDRFARTVLGYHGCDPSFAERILGGEISIAEWTPSTNDYDWLGHGIYFWEYAPERALSWRNNRSNSASGGVVGAIIQLGNCLDLTDLKDTQNLQDYFENIRLDFEQKGVALPANRNGRNFLDCLIINRLTKTAGEEGVPLQTVRCPFVEGGAVYEGSNICHQSHVQLVVKSPVNILGVFRPNLVD